MDIRPEPNSKASMATQRFTALLLAIILPSPFRLVVLNAWLLILFHLTVARAGGCVRSCLIRLRHMPLLDRISVRYATLAHRSPGLDSGTDPVVVLLRHLNGLDGDARK